MRASVRARDGLFEHRGQDTPVCTGARVVRGA
jgi:hypothetical protein